MRATTLPEVTFTSLKFGETSVGMERSAIKTTPGGVSRTKNKKTQGRDPLRAVGWSTALVARRKRYIFIPARHSLPRPTQDRHAVRSVSIIQYPRRGPQKCMMRPQQKPMRPCHSFPVSPSHLIPSRPLPSSPRPQPIAIAFAPGLYLVVDRSKRLQLPVVPICVPTVAGHVHDQNRL